MFTLDDLRWLVKQGIVTFRARYDTSSEEMRLTTILQLPAHVMDVIEDYKDDLWEEARTARREHASDMVE